MRTAGVVRDADFLELHKSQCARVPLPELQDPPSIFALEVGDFGREVGTWK